MERRLAAILAADVVGYSRLMGEDEGGTLERLKAVRKELVQPKITEHKGHIVKLLGDGLLAEFPSVVEAVQCAVDIQESMIERDADLPDERRIRLRIGVNLGDIIVEGRDIYGDGVNVAARLETLAEAGGICMSRTVVDHVKGKVELDFEDMGEQQLKNISEPIRVYRLVSDALGAQTARSPSKVLPLPDRPSVAVMPFFNMSADPDQEFFADGISEDIITELSKYRSLFVIARNSSFAFKGQSVDVKEVSRKLGVRYVVEGSVRCAGNHLRISAQLIDTGSHGYLWAERYDRQLEDIFAVQDEITRAIVTGIEPELESAERKRARRKLPESLDAWACYQRGLWHLYRYRAEDSSKAQQFFQHAIEFDPNFAPPYAALGYALYYEVIEGLGTVSNDWLLRAIEAAKTAVSLDERDSFGHMVLGRLLLADGEYDASIAACDAALALNTNDANAHYGQGLTLCFEGRPEAAIPKIDEALRLNPYDPGAWAFLWLKSHALILLHRYDEALIWARKAVHRSNATLWAFTGEAVALAYLGRIEEARVALNQALAIKPDLSSGFFSSVLPWKDLTHLALYNDGLRMAGLPE